MGKKIKKNLAGLTLIETLVAIAIFLIGISGFTLLFFRTWSYNKYTLEMGRSSMTVSQGVSKMVNYLRGAKQSDNGSYPVYSANDNDLVIYSDYDKDGVTERLHFYKSGTNVLMGVTHPDSSFPVNYPSGDQQTITIAQNIVNTSSDPIFQYFDQSYTGSQAPLTTPATASAVRLIRIFLKINIDINNAPNNIQTESFVELRNLSDFNNHVN